MECSTGIKNEWTRCTHRTQIVPKNIKLRKKMIGMIFTQIFKIYQISECVFNEPVHI